MKKLCLAIIVFVFLRGDLASAQEKNSDAALDISQRAIVYFYPNSKVPSETELAKYLVDYTRVDEKPKLTTRPIVALSILDDFEDSFPVPPLDYLAYSGRGLSKEQAESIQKSKQLLLMDVAYPESMMLSGYKPVVEFLFEIASSHKGLIWDSETRELFDPTAWKERRIDSWDGKFPNVTNHVTIHAYNNEEDEGIRAITLGMSKFGMPDVVVNNFSWASNSPVGNLINLTSQSLLEGAKPEKNGTLKLNICKLKNAEMRKNLEESLLENAVDELEVKFGQAKREDGDPDNLIIELLFDTAEGETLGERQDQLLSSLFGWEDSIVWTQHDDLVLAASKRAKAKLKRLRKDFNKGLNPGEFILLKAPFKTTDDTNEWMWVEVTSWKQKKIKGLLKNEPYYVPDLKAGSIVEVNQDDIFDYIRNFADGRSEGNETGEIMSKRQ